MHKRSCVHMLLCFCRKKIAHKQVHILVWRNPRMHINAWAPHACGDMHTLMSTEMITITNIRTYAHSIYSTPDGTLSLSFKDIWNFSLKSVVWEFWKQILNFWMSNLQWEHEWIIYIFIIEIRIPCFYTVDLNSSLCDIKYAFHCKMLFVVCHMSREHGLSCSAVWVQCFCHILPPICVTWCLALTYVPCIEDCFT